MPRQIKAAGTLGGRGRHKGCIPWSQSECEHLRGMVAAAANADPVNWQIIATRMPGRSAKQVRHGRASLSILPVSR